MPEQIEAKPWDAELATLRDTLGQSSVAELNDHYVKVICPQGASNYQRAYRIYIAERHIEERAAILATLQASWPKAELQDQKDGSYTFWPQGEQHEENG